jgi:uncharacterized protein
LDQVPDVNEREAASTAIFVATLINLGFALAFGFRYASLAGPTEDLKHALFLYSAAIGQLSLLFSIIGFLLLALSRLRIGRKALIVAAPLAFGLLGLFLFLDQAIYGLFRFHVNALVVNIALSPVMRDATDISRGDVITLLVIGVVLVVGEALVFWWLRRRFTAPSWRPRWGVLVAAILALFAVEKVIYAAGDLRGERHIVRSARAVPYYHRITIRNFAQALGWVPRKMSTVRRRPVKFGRLQYPKNPLVFEAPAKKPNIVWINLEGWRWDMFSEENTPNLHAWSRNEQVFDYHVSGGNRTATGVFSMFYALHGNYWDTFLSERKPPVLVSRLRELGYKIDADASREVGFFDMKSATFVDIPEAYHIDWPTDDSDVRDQAIVDHWKTFVDSAGSEPFFSWTLFDSSHVKYYFPPEFAKFEPYAKDVSYRELSITEQRKIEARNRYRNAVLYEDSLVKKMLDHLREKGLLDSTVVIVSGDHGEEFYENGYWTHGGGCTPQVVRVPLIVHVPGKAPGQFTKVTSHHDIVPTLMEMLGAKNPSSDYAVGANLFGDETVPHVVACGWDQSALIDSSGWLIFGNDFQNPWDYEIRDPDYVEIEDAGTEMERRSAQVAGAIRSMNAFLK